jgi:hypothetical protein
MSHRITLPSLLTGLIAVAALAACGTSSSTSSSSAASSSSSAATAAPAAGSSSAAAVSAGSCPSASTVGGALGVTAGAPTTIDESSSLPSGASGYGCEYLVGTSVVIVVKATNVPSNYFSTEESAQQATDSQAGLAITFQPVSGVGSEAASYTYSAGGLTATGVIAQQGSTVAGVFTSMLTGATVGQCENLVKQLL